MQEAEPLALPDIEEPPKLNRHQRRKLIAQLKRKIAKVKIIHNERKLHKQSQAKKAGNNKWWLVGTEKKGTLDGTTDDSPTTGATAHVEVRSLWGGGPGQDNLA